MAKQEEVSGRIRGMSSSSLSCEPRERVVVVDALRGFAVLTIFLLHCLEHFIYDVYPPQGNLLMDSLNQSVKEVFFFLFAGKSYSIFALLFGFTFAVQYRNRQAQGQDFCGRFAWRLLLLTGFATLNAVFFPGGDVLMLFAVMGLVLIPARKFGQRTLLVAACCLLAQPLEIYGTIRALCQPGWSFPVFLNDSFYPAVKTAVDTGNFWTMAGVNATTGQAASFLWALDAGRLIQAPGLFLLGLFLGRGGYFSRTDGNAAFWSRVLVLSFASALVLFVCKGLATVPASLTTLLTMWYNVAFTGIWVSAFVLLYRQEWFSSRCSGLTFYGRMSLTNYVGQSVLGSLIFFPYALNLSPHLGLAASLLAGCVLAWVQIVFCRWWLSRYKLGPLEGFWHRLTWLNGRK